MAATSSEHDSRRSMTLLAAQWMCELSVRSGNPACLKARVQVTGRDDAAFRSAELDHFLDRTHPNNNSSHIRYATHVKQDAHKNNYRTEH